MLGMFAMLLVVNTLQVQVLPLCRRNQYTSLLESSSRPQPRQHLQRVAITMFQMAILSGTASSLLFNSKLPSSRLP